MLDLLTLNADQLGILAVIAAKRDQAETIGTNCEKQANAPGYSNSSDFLSGDAVSGMLAGGTGRSCIAAALVSEVDDHWSLLLLRRRRIISRRRRAVRCWCSVWWGCSVRLSVHLSSNDYK